MTETSTMTADIIIRFKINWDKIILEGEITFSMMENLQCVGKSPTSLLRIHILISSNDLPNFVDSSSANDRTVWYGLTKYVHAR